MLGKAAVAIWCDVAPEVKEDFDDWHVHEHTPERLSIPGFLRGSRWVSVDGQNSYHMLYELEALEVLTAGPYLERLNNPTPWSTRMMPNHRNMVRSLCRVQESHGAGLGEATLTVRFSQPWNGADLLAKLPARKGLAAAHLLKDAGAVQGGPTAEERIRGGDARADWVLLVRGYNVQALERLATELPGGIARVYRLAYALTARDLGK
jgi:hypothetical protein